MAEALGVDPREVDSMPADLFYEGVAYFNIIVPELREKARNKAQSRTKINRNH